MQFIDRSSKKLYPPVEVQLLAIIIEEDFWPKLARPLQIRRVQNAVGLSGTSPQLRPLKSHHAARLVEIDVPGKETWYTLTLGIRGDRPATLDTHRQLAEKLNQYWKNTKCRTWTHPGASNRPARVTLPINEFAIYREFDRAVSWRYPFQGATNYEYWYPRLSRLGLCSEGRFGLEIERNVTFDIISAKESTTRRRSAAMIARHRGRR